MVTWGVRSPTEVGGKDQRVYDEKERVGVSGVSTIYPARKLMEY